MMYFRLFLSSLGAIQGLLIARLIVRLFAGRTDNPVIQFLLLMSDPLIAPFKGLDAGQPRFGAVLELSTLLLIVSLSLIIIGLRWWWQRKQGQ